VVLGTETIPAASIVGTILTPAGVPVPGVLVTVTHGFPPFTGTDTTDASGGYRVVVVDLANYAVTPSKSGYTFTPPSATVTVAFSDVTNNFTTTAGVPVATTQASENITPTSATLKGSVNADGAATTAWFEYGLTTSYGSVTSSTNLGNGVATVAVNSDVAALLRQTNYHLRVVASNSFGVSFGSDASFTTLSGIPSVSTLEPTAYTATSVQLNGSAIPNDLSASGWFEWGTTTNYGNLTAPISLSGTSPVNFSQALTGLMPGATYHYRAAAATSYSTNYGADTAFTLAFNDLAADLAPGVNLSSAAWGDYDNDGRLDILLTGQDYNNTGKPVAQVWRNTGSGFSLMFSNLTGVTESSVAWGDYDNDGRLDILLTGYDANMIPVAQVWRNTGSGFTNINAGLPGVGDSSVAWGDYDNDGRLDILLSGFGPGANFITQVWRNTGSGFTNINAGLPGVIYSSVAWGDYDNDGRLDILLSGEISTGEQITQVWRNTGSGFTNINAGLPGVSHGSVAWGDYDNDGRLDILVTGYSSTGSVAQVWRNTGSGFTNINAGLPAVAGSSAAWGDYDNDGRLDILLTGNLVSAPYLTSQVWRNTGSGFTNDLNTALPGVQYGSVAWGDFNNDGRLDILLTGSTVTNSVMHAIAQVWRSHYPATNSPPAAPTGLAMTATTNAVMLSWSSATDAQTPAAGLSYNVRAGTTAGGTDLLAAHANPTTGFRRLPVLGNAQLRHGLPLTGVTNGQTVFWSVQAVDSAFAGGPFASETSVVSLPQLSIAGGAAGNAVISWTPPTFGWVLQESTPLSTGVWSNSPSGELNPVTVAATNPARFYRLTSP
jgi:hypothetical protein